MRCLAVPVEHEQVLRNISSMLTVSDLHLTPRREQDFDPDGVMAVITKYWNDMQGTPEMQQLEAEDQQEQQQEVANALVLYDGAGMPPQHREQFTLLQLQWGHCFQGVTDSGADLGRGMWSGMGIPSPLDIMEFLRILNLASEDVTRVLTQVFAIREDEIAARRALFLEIAAGIEHNDE
jgi:hypothetical protein